VRASTRTAGLIRRLGSTPEVLAAIKMAVPIRVDGSMRVCATNRSGALIRTVGRTKVLCATTSATAL
jgi:hypothetical protein